MNGLETKYLHYSSGKSEITIPRKSLEFVGLNWKHKDPLVLVVSEIEGKEGLFLAEQGKGHVTRYSYYVRSKKSSVTIPRLLLEANNLNWKHKDTIVIVPKEIDGEKGLFLYKKEENES